MPRYEDVWRMHCEGMAVPEIARELRIDPELARAIIVERWAEDKAEAARRRSELRVYDGDGY